MQDFFDEPSRKKRSKRRKKLEWSPEIKLKGSENFVYIISYVTNLQQASIASKLVLKLLQKP